MCASRYEVGDKERADREEVGKGVAKTIPATVMLRADYASHSPYRLIKLTSKRPSLDVVGTTFFLLHEVPVVITAPPQHPSARRASSCRTHRRHPSCLLPCARKRSRLWAICWASQLRGSGHGPLPLPGVCPPAATFRPPSPAQLPANASAVPRLPPHLVPAPV